MARVKLSEYKAKQLLLGSAYKGVQLRSGEKMAIPKGAWVAKVDQGVKKRMKQGLVAVNLPSRELAAKVRAWEQKGFSQFLLEPYIEHELSEEQYISFERVREGVRVLHAQAGGIDIEAHPEAVQTYVIRTPADVGRIAKECGLPPRFLSGIVDAFDRNFFAFLEVNPLVVRDGRAYLLDAAVLVDSAGEFFVRRAWTDADVVRGRAKHVAEEKIEKLAATTPASLKLSVFNENGSLFLLLSGGGGSIVIADEAKLLDAGQELGNYGEYSGGPSREETYLYAKEVLALCLASKAKKKALVIAGGIANFTDVRHTFLGIIDALAGSAASMRKQGIKVFVRRGGPHEREGLALMRDFLEREGLLGSVQGSEAEITSAMRQAIAHTRI